MFDLIYPAGEVPVLPPPTAENVRQGPVSGEVTGSGLSGYPGQGTCGQCTTGSRRNEMFPVIKSTGEVIAKASRTYCHSGVKVLHPVVHLHIIDRYERLYLQKRSMKKDIQPGRWDTAVGGHVDYGEQVLEALYRETSEELNFTRFNPIYMLSYEFESDRELEMVNVFAAVGNFQLSPDRDEVEEGRWWTFDEIKENLGKSVFTPNFEQEFTRISRSLLALL